MVEINHIHIIDKRVFLIIMLFAVNSQALADEALGSTIDCSDVEIHFVDNPEWTHSERLEAMDRAFFESVDHFELCNLSNQSGTSSAPANGTNQASNTSPGSEAGHDSVASQEMTGTETESTSSQDNSSKSSNVAENANNESVKVNRGSSINGAKPKDIPDAANDDAIASQIRLAAEIEKDPVKKEKLWNEYRKYKGLPANDNK
jgi:hypothetical protein